VQVKQGLPGGITEAMTVCFIVAGQLYSYFSFLLPVAPPKPAQTQKRAQVGETAQEFSQNDVSQLCELAMAKAMCPTVCVCAFLCMSDISPI